MASSQIGHVLVSARFSVDTIKWEDLNGMIASYVFSLYGCLLLVHLKAEKRAAIQLRVFCQRFFYAGDENSR